MKIENLIKQPGFEDNYHKVIVNLIFSGNWMRDQNVRALKDFDVLPQHYNVLRSIKGKHPLPASPGEIKEVMIDKSNDLTRLLDKLEKNGWVKRELCPTNRRRMDVTLTPEGQKILNQMNRAVSRISNGVAKNISVREAGQLSKLLDKMRG